MKKIVFATALLASNITFATSLFSYTVVTKGDLIGECSDFMGRTAVGKDAYLRDFLVQSETQQGCPLEVSGLLKMVRGSVSNSNGFTCAKAQQFDLDQTGIADMQYNDIDNEDLAQQMNQATLQLANMTSGTQRVINLNPSDIKDGRKLVLETQGSEALIINLAGAQYSFNRIDIVLQGSARPSNIIWNFFEASSVVMKNSGVRISQSGLNLGLPGTILAPYAEVKLNNMLVTGAVFADKFVGQAEAENCSGRVSGQVNPDCFQSTIPGVGCERTIRRGKGGVYLPQKTQ